MMKILVIDGQGGGIGRQIVSSLRQKYPQLDIIAVGTNSIATSAMIKAGSSTAATGENAVICNCRQADVIIGPIGIAIADSLAGEISPAMALAVAQSNAVKLLLPVNRCNNIIIGVSDLSVSSLIQQTLEQLEKLI